MMEDKIRRVTKFIVLAPLYAPLLILMVVFLPFAFVLQVVWGCWRWAWLKAGALEDYLTGLYED